MNGIRVERPNGFPEAPKSAASQGPPRYNRAVWGHREPGLGLRGGSAAASGGQDGRGRPGRVALGGFEAEKRPFGRWVGGRGPGFGFFSG